MKTLILSGLLLLGLGKWTPQGTEPPQVILSNGLISTTLYLPDTSQGYYRGTRFDWSGAFKNLDYKGHHFIDQWFETYDPKIHDAITGPVEAFTPLDFAQTKPGETFVKIGVGRLRKPDDKPYAIGTYYHVADYGTWTVKTHKTGRMTTAVDFTQELTDPTGYGYRYTKTVRLIKGKPEMVLEHRLENTGRKPMETSVYNHNFFVIDNQPTGPQIAVRFPFAVQGEGKGFGSTIVAKGNSLHYTRDLDKKEQVFSAGLQGFGPTADSYDIRIENLKTGAGVRTTGNQPLEKIVYWACATTSCPEPYVRISVAPGQAFSWNVGYEFYQNVTP